jgi:hypothetical protein
MMCDNLGLHFLSLESTWSVLGDVLGVTPSKIVVLLAQLALSNMDQISVAGVRHRF